MKEFRKTNFGLSYYITSQNKCTKRNFALSKYSDTTGRKLKCYELTRDGLYKCRRNLSRRKFAPSKYTNTRGREYKCYEMDRDGFTLLVMGYTTENALKFKLWYINRFNEMEELLKTRLLCKENYPKLTKALFDKDKTEWYHYSNEINSIVLRN